MTPHQIRRCIVCGKREHMAELIRLSVSGEEVIWDKERNLPGRGAHCHTSCVEGLALPKVYSRAFGSKIKKQLQWKEVLKTLQKVFGQS